MYRDSWDIYKVTLLLYSLGVADCDAWEARTRAWKASDARIGGRGWLRFGPKREMGVGGARRWLVSRRAAEARAWRSAGTGARALAAAVAAAGCAEGW